MNRVRLLFVMGIENTARVFAAEQMACLLQHRTISHSRPFVLVKYDPEEFSFCFIKIYDAGN
jgi:hypothetical protein